MTYDQDNVAIVRRNFAERLRTAIAEQGWSQSEFARQASKHLPAGELSRDNVSNYLRESALLGDAFLLAMARAFGKEPSELLPERAASVKRPSGVVPTMEVSDIGEGFAFLRLNRRLPWPVALEILAAVNRYDFEAHSAADCFEEGDV